MRIDARCGITGLLYGVYYTDTAKRMHVFFDHIAIPGDLSFEFTHKELSSKICNALLFGFVFK